MTFSWIITKLVGPILTLLTPQIKKMLEQLLKDWYRKAQETESPLDDLAAAAICKLLGVEV